MSRPLEFSIGEYYHIYNRGTDKRITFIDQADYDRFLMLLYLCNDIASLNMSRIKKFNKKRDIFSLPRNQPIVNIGAYCLMQNHFHLLVKEIQEGGISLFMQKLLTAYTMYFNRKYSRTGSLFSSTFKATHAHNDRYLKYLFSYIHLNPIKIIDPLWKEQGILDITTVKNFLDTYSYSSYPDYCGYDRKEKTILTTDTFPQYFTTLKEMEKSITDWLKM